MATLRARLEGETGLRVRLQHRLSRARKAIVDLLIPLDSDAETDANPVPFSSADDDLSAELARRLMATAPAGPDH